MALPFVEQALETILRESTEVTAWVKDRIKPLVVSMRDQQKPPYLTFQFGNPTYNETFCATENTRTKECVIDVWDDDYYTAKVIAEEVRTLLHRYSGTVGQIVIKDILHTGESEDFAIDTDGGEIKYFNVSLTFDITYGTN